jgi:mersacidin/lichenicidin family type 2 lantibiotic
MSQVNVVRAWKDEEYRQSLTEAERAALPENPAGLLDLAEPDLQQSEGGFIVGPRPTVFLCTFNGCLHTLLVVNCP